MASRPRLVAFDMDHTLIDVSEAHLDGFREALETAYCLDASIDLKKHSGNTQLNAIRLICEDQGLDPELVESRLSEALEILSQRTVARLDDDLRAAVLPGAVPLLDSLRERAHPLALVTGTIRSVADVILERARLDEYFSVTACGDEGRKRTDLLELMLARGARVFGLESRDRAVVVGDSTRDIWAAKETGLGAVGVATGFFSVEELSEHEPDAVLPSLEDHQAALSAILDS